MFVFTNLNYSVGKVLIIIELGFLINHSLHYNVAISFAIFEYWIEYYFLKKELIIIITLGLLMVMVGHIFRIGAFLSAK